MLPFMRTDEAIKHFGGVRELARVLETSTQAIYKWGKRVPRGRAFELQVITGGKLRVEPEKRAS